MKTHYIENVIPKLKKALECDNVHALPKLMKVSVNVGIGSYIQKGGDKKFENVIENVTLLTGQKPVVTKAKKAISNFKLREGMPVGISVTLRGERMHDFLQKVVHIALPRIRDFRGISVKGFDGKGNYTLGLKEATVFPEVNPENLNRNHGLQIVIHTSANTNKEGYLLLKELGFPFKDEIQ